MILNEVSDMGTEGTCEGKDWIELFNQGTEVLALEGYVVDNGAGSEYTFHSGHEIQRRT